MRVWNHLLSYPGTTPYSLLGLNPIALAVCLESVMKAWDKILTLVAPSVCHEFQNVVIPNYFSLSVCQWYVLSPVFHLPLFLSLNTYVLLLPPLQLFSAKKIPHFFLQLFIYFNFRLIFSLHSLHMKDYQPCLWLIPLILTLCCKPSSGRCSALHHPRLSYVNQNIKK